MFSKKPIPDSELKKILEAARFAPTPHNSQPFEIIVVKDEEIKKQLSEVGFRLDKKEVDEHFYWVRHTIEELETKKDGVYVDVLPNLLWIYRVTRSWLMMTNFGGSLCTYTPH